MPDLINALSKIKGVKKDSKNPFLKNKYASLDAIIEASKPVLAEHNLAAIQIVNDDGIETVILHKSGEWIASDYLKIMSEISKGLSAAQAVGVATTYAKRYQLGAILNISTEEDTDGQYGDNKDLEPATKHPEDNRPWLTEKQLQSALNRIAAGDQSVFQKTVDAFRMKKEYRKQLEEEKQQYEVIDAQVITGGNE